jgi:signal transduction histidine kinase
VVEKHKGKIFFETQAGAGTTFVVRLPIAASVAAPAATMGG